MPRYRTSAPFGMLSKSSAVNSGIYMRATSLNWVDTGIEKGHVMLLRSPQEAAGTRMHRSQQRSNSLTCAKVEGSMSAVSKRRRTPKSPASLSSAAANAARTMSRGLAMQGSIALIRKFPLCHDAAAI